MVVHVLYEQAVVVTCAKRATARCATTRRGGNNVDRVPPSGWTRRPSGVTVKWGGEGCSHPATLLQQGHGDYNGLDSVGTTGAAQRTLPCTFDRPCHATTLQCSCVAVQVCGAAHALGS